MSGDPKECRLRALQCSRMAQRAATPEQRRVFLRLLTSWSRLAHELEDAEAFLATRKARDLGGAMDANRVLPNLDPSSRE
jgi:hypothetical protein